MVKILIRTPFGRFERLWATPIAGGLYRLENSLFLGYDLSFHDVVEAVPSGEGPFPVVTRVHTKSGNRTIRAHVKEGLESEKGRTVRSAINELGSTYEVANDKILSITVPPKARLEQLSQSLADHGADFEYVDPRAPPARG
jgi:hypothetical protein